MTARPARSEAGLEQALDLLKGPSDERRFVGLLLVSKFVSPGNNEHIQRVQEAVGFTFLQRLLLPLKSHCKVAPAADMSQQIAAAELALAVLSTFSSVSSVAAYPEMQELVPLLSKVVIHGGIAAVAGTTTADEVSAIRQQQDAVECLLGICSGSDQGRTVVLESQGIKAAGSGLAQAPTALQLAAPSLRLLALLCAQPTGAQAEEGELAIALPATAWCLAAPAHLLTLRPHGPSPSASHPAPGNQGQASSSSAEPPAAPSSGNQAGGASTGGAAETVSNSVGGREALPKAAAAGCEQADQAFSSTQEGCSGSDDPGTEPAARPAAALTDPAAIQLEALRCLLLLLPACLRQAEPLKLRQSSAETGCWQDLRTGMRLLLVGRAGQAQRHGALQVAALFQQLCANPAWLLGTSGHNTQEDSFFQLLAELLGIEFTILLRDALAPYHAASTSSEPIASAVPEDLDLIGDMPIATDAGVEVEDQLKASPSRPPGSRGTSDALAFQVAQGLSLKHKMDAERNPACLPSPSKAADQAEAAWQRAQDMVPACCVLYEACVEALAASSGDVEDADGALHAPSSSGLISDRVATVALRTLDNTAGTLLQYLETVATMTETHEDPLILAVIRALGRFLADVPRAHPCQVKQLWAFMTTVQGGQGEAFLLPYSMQE
ncbi:hypothetical protein WJX74_009822 [Apatococcus lobatus]|uniref:Neurochondrin n=1 Tax=Apatococcus lobatus TaxID=904363 RepID=A0AAW1QIA3_9CHLO